MKPIFTIHAGEYIAGSFLEKKGLNVWIPTKDTGVDFLVSNKQNTKIVSLQVKFSKDYFVQTIKNFYPKELRFVGWWTLYEKKIKQSKADYWIFVMYGFENKSSWYLIIKPDELLNRLNKLGISGNKMDLYFIITNKNRCYCGWKKFLKKDNQKQFADSKYNSPGMDFSQFLGNWQQILSKLK